MRIRVVKPDFWSDSVIANLPIGARLFYIGLWMFADDAGWMKWQPVEIAAGLFPYQSRRARERTVDEWLALLVDAKRVVLHDCGHAVIPTLVVHQKTGGNRTTKIRDEHATYCPSGQVRTSPDESVRKGKEGKGKEGKEEEPSVVPFHRQGRGA